MQSDRDLLKQALEALEINNQAWKQLADSGDAGFWEAEKQPFYGTSVKAITALRERLAQPEQEPNTIANSEAIPEQISEHTKKYVTEQEPSREWVAHSIVAGALFDFMGWLTTCSERLVLSSADDAAPAADAIKNFAQMRSLSINDAQVQEWQEHLTTPPRREWQGLTKEDFSAINQSCLTKLQAATSAESILKEKNNA